MNWLSRLIRKENELEKHKESFRIPSFTAFDPPGSMNQISSSRGPDGFSRIANFFESSSKKDSETAASQSQLNNVRKCFSLDAPPEEILKAIASTLDIKSITPFKSEDPAIEAQGTKDKIETSELRLVCQRLDRLLTYVRHHNISKYERMNRKKKESISLLELNDFNEAEPQKVVTRKIEPKSEPNNEEEKKSIFKRHKYVHEVLSEEFEFKSNAQNLRECQRRLMKRYPYDIQKRSVCLSLNYSTLVRSETYLHMK